MRSSLLRVARLMVLACAANAAACDDDPDARVVVAWNERVLSVAHAEDGFLTLKGVRATAMLHLAVHDALNSIDRRYAEYAFHTDAAGALPLVAAAQAAYDIAIDQYPGARLHLNDELHGWLAPIADGPAKQQAIELGKNAAAAVLSRRAEDGWNREGEYEWRPPGPGVYAGFPEHSATPPGFVFGAGWALAKPFALRSSDQFRSPPPPAIVSDAYTRAYEEVKEVGRFQSPSRTADQTHLAFWWKDFAESSHNRLARQLVAGAGVDLWTAARMFAQLNMSIMDGYIAVFDNKFFYNHWRPYTAIREAEHDGNPRTAPDLGWNNAHRHTYPFPSYPSAHGTVCAAAMTILAGTFGDGHAFTMHTPEVSAAGPMSPMIRMEPPSRRFDRFSAAAKECAGSRVYLGIHFRYDAIEGTRLGTQVGAYVARNTLAQLTP